MPQALRRYKCRRLLYVLGARFSLKEVTFRVFASSDWVDPWYSQSARSIPIMNPVKRVLSILCLVFCLVPTSRGAAVTRSYNDLVEAYFKDYLVSAPSTATSLGFHEYDGKFEDFSEAAHTKNQRMLHGYLKEFETLDAS